MKKFLYALLLVAILAANTAWGEPEQRSPYDNINSPYYQIKSSIYRSMPRQEGGIVFLGDSLTDYIPFKELFPDLPVINRAIAGDTTVGVLNRLDEVISLKPAKLFLLIGCNDIVFNTTLDETIANIKQIVTRLREESLKTKIYLETVLPVNHQFETNRPAEAIKAINLRLVKLADELNCPLIDTYSQFAVDDELPLRYTVDGIHLNGEGVLRRVEFLSKWINEKIVGFLPLDTRQYAYDMPIGIGRLCGAKVIFTPRELLADFNKRPDIPALQARAAGFPATWLERIAGGCDVLVISAEQLVYGGLIQSREAKGKKEDIKKALDLLRRIKAKHPDVPIYLSNTLMRTSISAVDKESVKWWQKVNEYSAAYYRAKSNGDEAAQAELEHLTSEIPEHVLNTFLNARALGHELNLGCIQLVKEGVVEQLMLFQEDTSGDGIQRFEQEELTKIINESGIGDKIFMANGTGEGGCELIARSLRPDGREAEIVWLGDNSGFTAMYEDRPFIENLKAHMAALRIKPVRGANPHSGLPTEDVICILPPKRRQGDYVMGRFDGYEPYSDVEFNDMAQRVFDLTRQGKRVFLLDVDCANGGSPALLTAIAKRMPVLELYGYSAWDTASNSLGTLLAQLLACGGVNGPENRRLTAESILNDCVYLSAVRQQVSEVLKVKGVDIWNIPAQNTGDAQQALNEAFAENKPLLYAIFGGNIPDFKAILRWPRLFEIEMRIINVH